MPRSKSRAIGNAPANVGRRERIPGEEPSGPDRLDPARVKLFCYLLAAGVAGVVVCCFALYTASGERVVQRLGMERVASHWDGILSILAVPALMLFGVLGVWAASELCLSYRAMNDPNSYRRRRTSRSS